jgi:hypothetical protein
LPGERYDPPWDIDREASLAVGTRRIERHEVQAREIVGVRDTEVRDELGVAAERGMTPWEWPRPVSHL